MSHIQRKILWGALAGGFGGLAMKALVRFVDRQAFGLSARTDAKSAHELWRRLNWGPLEERTAENIGVALHYAFAVGSGAGYAILAERWPAIRKGRGVLFGTGLWLVGDEVAVTAMRLEDPRQTALPSHLSAWAAHLAYAFVVDATVDQLT